MFRNKFALSISKGCDLLENYISALTWRGQTYD